jgi:hypothetical protein
MFAILVLPVSLSTLKRYSVVVGKRVSGIPTTTNHETFDPGKLTVKSSMHINRRSRRRVRYVSSWVVNFCLDAFGVLDKVLLGHTTSKDESDSLSSFIHDDSMDHLFVSCEKKLDAVVVDVGLAMWAVEFTQTYHWHRQSVST